MDFNKIVARVKNILLTPKTEWPVIAQEPETVASLYKNYILILAAIPAIMAFISMSVIGINVPFVGTMRLDAGTGIVNMIVTYAIRLAVIYLVMLLIDALAPTFGGQKNQVQALKSAAYSATPGMVASVFLVLGVGLGSLVGLAAAIYGIYLLYIGLPHTMKCPQEKAGGYAAVTIIAGFLAGIVLGYVLSSVTGISSKINGGMLNMQPSSSSTFTPAKDSPLGALVAMGQRAEQASKKMEAAQKSGDANAQAAAAGQMLGAVLGGGGQVEALAPDALKPFLPDTLAGLPRASYDVSKQAPLGMQVAIAEGTYRNADGNGPSYDLKITDMGSAKGLMALAGFAGIEEDKQSDHGYEKTYHQNGNLVHEQWNNNGHGEYTVVLGDRFVVEVTGNKAPNMDAIKAALAGVNLSGLAALKNQGVKNG